MENPVKKDTELLKNIVHELRGSFGIISGLATLLPLAKNDTERNAMLSRLLNNISIATNTFSRLLDYIGPEESQEVSGRKEVESIE